jgi:predicted nucleic acid-binding protein
VILLDTSFLYALNDRKDKNHNTALALVQTLAAPLFLPTPVLAELCYLLHTRLGHHAMRQFLRGLSESNIRLLLLTSKDIKRTVGVLDRYTHSKLDFADAAIVVIAKRYGITRIATFDRRDFAIIRPRHTSYFELLP